VNKVIQTIFYQAFRIAVSGEMEGESAFPMLLAREIKAEREGEKLEWGRIGSVADERRSKHERRNRKRDIGGRLNTVEKRMGVFLKRGKKPIILH